MFNGELMSMPLFAAVGVLGGLLRDVAPDKEAIWKFSPFPDLTSGASAQARLRLPAFSLLCIWRFCFRNCCAPARAVPAQPGGLRAPAEMDLTLPPWIVVAVYATTLFATVLPIKVWNSNRNERKLEQQQLRLNEARLAALSRQINPHFLFNTLNSVTSLIRQDPDQARQVVYKLSNILRRLLRQQENLHRSRGIVVY